ncbi:MAG: BsaWI family type II restriction enzyme [Chloroflexota bacterium]|nr:BsaWI family type II restriction enzyme [Pseudomonadota bacterium]MDQ3695901.1 BsaWI family type II restriction enzyme [Chloroflexota bacterium]
MTRSTLASLICSRGHPTHVKNRAAIAEAFRFGLEICPTINASDLWHHIIYREYVRTVKEVRRVNDAKQSWVRSSGDAFEVHLQDYYNARLAADGVWLTALFSDADSKKALEEMGIEKAVGGSKLDLSIRTADRIVGGIHAKVSLAERVSDDVPASLAMMQKGYLTALVTLDVKSFPPATNVGEARAYQNRGEFGTPASPSDKRRYIENHGSFDLCLSYNARTVPSLLTTESSKRIDTVAFGGPPDPLEQAIRARLF